MPLGTQASTHDNRHAGPGQASLAGRHRRRSPLSGGVRAARVARRAVVARPAQSARIDRAHRLAGAKSATACARNFVDYLKRDGAAQAIIVLYPPSDGLLHPSVKPLANALTKHLTRARIEVRELLCVCDGRWWSMQCTDADCCPPAGSLIARDATSELAVAMTVEGRVVLGSREELAQMLDPVGGLAAAAMAYAMPRVHEEFAARVFAGQKRDVVAESLALFRAAVEARLNPEARRTSRTSSSASTTRRG